MVQFDYQYLKFKDLKSYFIKSNISTFTDIELYLFSTVFATLKTRFEKNRGTGQISQYRAGTGTSSNFTGTGTGSDRNPGRVLLCTDRLLGPYPCLHAVHQKIK